MIRRNSWHRARPLLVAAACAMLCWHPLGASQQADPPRILERVAAVVPDSLAALRLSGWVLVQVRIDSTGTVTEAIAPPNHVASRYFFGRHASAFRDAAESAARGYRFRPGAGEASPSGVFAIPIPFDAPRDTTVGPTGTLVGRLRAKDPSAVPSWAGVCIPDARMAVLIPGPGPYRLENVPAGPRQVIASASYFCSVRRTVVIHPGGTDTLDFALPSCDWEPFEMCLEVPRR